MPKQQTKANWLNDQIKKYRQRNAVLETIISAGAPVRSTAIGRVMWDVRTCTCPVKAKVNVDHDDGCTVQPVLDSGPIIAATRELRLNDADIASLLSLKEETAEPADTSQLDMFVSQYEVMASENHELRLENERLRCEIAAVTGIYPVTSIAGRFELASGPSELPPYGSQLNGATSRGQSPN